MQNEVVFQSLDARVVSKEVLAVDDPVHSLQKRSNYIVFRYFYLFFRTHKICFEKNATVAKSTGLAISTIVKSKKFLLDRSLIEIKVCDTWQKGKISYVYPTDLGWAKYHQIEAFKKKQKKEPVEKLRKAKVYSYTESDLKTAKIWLTTIKKWWRGYPQKQASLPSWDEEKEERAEGIRKAREKVGMTDKEFLNVIREVIQFPDNKLKFFVENIVAANKWTGKKWANGKTPVEYLVDAYYSNKKTRMQKEGLVLNRDKEFPIPNLFTIDPNEEIYGDEQIQIKVKRKNTRDAWKILWDSIADRIRRNFYQADEMEKQSKILQNICMLVGDFSYAFGYNFRTIRFQNREIEAEWEDCSNKDAGAFFYYMKDKHLNDGKWFFNEDTFQRDFIDFITKINAIAPCSEGQDQFEDDVRSLQECGIMRYIGGEKCED